MGYRERIRQTRSFLFADRIGNPLISGQSKEFAGDLAESGKSPNGRCDR